jgi:hypothetical protein
MSISNKKNAVIDFLRGVGTDFKGRTHADILGCDDIKMEQCHDQIQQIFPIHERSKMTQNDPIITPEIVEEAKKYPEIKENLRKALDRMKRFYRIMEYALEDGDVHPMWDSPNDHNFLRITRMIRCLRLFGLEKEAKEFYDEMRYIDNNIGLSPNACEYWKKAMEDDVWKTLR